MAVFLMFRYLSHKQHALNLFQSSESFPKKNPRCDDNEKEFLDFPAQPQKENVFLRFLTQTQKLHSTLAAALAEGSERGKQGSMIIKLRKDKKIVNDMFKQGMFGAAWFEERRKNKKLMYESGNE